MSRKKPKQRVTQYFTSIQYAICHGPVEKLISLRVNDKILGKCARLQGPVIYIDAPELFGGVKKEGGLRGRMAWQEGTEDQLIDPYIAQKKGLAQTDMPGYRGIATAYFTELPVEYTETGGLVGTLLRQAGGTFATLASLIFGLPAPQRKGFYWSANQPIIPPTHFRITRVDRSWRSDIAAIPGAIDTDSYAVCIAIDMSLSMAEGNRLDAAKSAAITLLKDLRTSEKPETFDIRIVGWGGTATVMQIRNCTDADYATLINFVLSLSLRSATVFSKAVEGLQDFYDGAGTKCRLFVFLTDGEPNDPADATAAGVTLAATGAEAYAFNIELSNTTETAKMDNTPGDGVPVFFREYGANYLGNLFRATSTQQIDMNPAHMIRECLLNSVWGLGLPESALDMDMFEDAAEALFDERFGLSMIWTRQSGVQDFISEILSHIQGTVYVNPMNGKISLKLIRNDYDVATLDLLNPSNCKVTSFKRRTPAEVTNEIAVTWTNPNTEKEEVVTLQSLGSIVANNGEIVSDNRNYYGVRRADLAAELAARDLAASTAPLSTAEVKANRAFSRKVPGDVVKLTDPENGAVELIMRIMKVEYGRPGDSEINLTLTEDVFSYAKPRFILPPVTQNVDQTQQPTPPSAAEVMTTNPYLNQTAGDALDDLVDPETQVAFFVATNNSDSFDAEIFQEEPNSVGTLEFVSVGEFDFVGRALLTTALPAEAESVITLPASANGSQPEVAGFALFGATGIPENRHEIVLLTERDAVSGEWTLARGVMDTVPWEWPVGTPVRYFSDTNRIVSPNADSYGIPIDFRFQPRTSTGTLDASEAPVVSYTPTDRLYAPARPANVYVAGIPFGDLEGHSITSVEVTWANRNRLTEGTVLLRWTEGTISPEAGQTTTVRLIDYYTGATIIDYAGLTGTSFSFDPDDRGTCSRIRVAILAVRDGFESIQGHEIELDFNYGILLEDADTLAATALLLNEDGSYIALE